MSGWLYLKVGLLSDEHVGPLTAEALLQMALDGQLRLDTLVCHPEKTQGQWVQMQRISGLLQKYQQGEAARQRDRDQAKADREAQAQAKRQVAEEQRAEGERLRQESAQRLAEQQARLPFAKFMLDGQPPAVVAKSAKKPRWNIVASARWKSSEPAPTTSWSIPPPRTTPPSHLPPPRHPLKTRSLDYRSLRRCLIWG